jgi:hypothetical protein
LRIVRELWTDIAALARELNVVHPVLERWAPAAEDARG